MPVSAAVAKENEESKSLDGKVSEDDIPDVPWYRSTRITLSFVSAWGYIFFYLLRIDLSMAIVCMVRDPTDHLINSSHHMWFYENVTLNSWSTTDPEVSIAQSTALTAESSCSVLNSGLHLSKYTGELEWSKELRGYVLSSFFYGYAVTQIPGGWLASRYGGKHVFGGGFLVTVIATVLVPVASRSSVYLLIILRFIMGLGCGVGFPATHHLYGQWIPPLERSKLMTFAYAGTYLGTIVALSVSGLLCEIEFDNGWPLIFYIYGGASFIWWIFWNYFVFKSPGDHPRIDPIEREYITQKIGKKLTRHDGKIPWFSIFRSMPVWAIIVAHSCNNWASYTILICIPMYMKEVLQFDIAQNGMLSALPHIIAYVAAIAFGQIADTLREKKILSTTATRKIFQCTSSAVPGVLITCVGLIECELRYVAVVLLCLNLTFNAGCRPGFTVNHVDLSPNHAGVLYGISNTVATIPGMVAPIVAGALTPNGTREEWMNVFIVCCVFYVFSTIFYAVFASGELQPWAQANNTKEDGKLCNEISTTRV